LSEEGERKQLDGSAKLSGGLLALIRAHRDAVEKVDMLVIIIRCVTEGRSPKFVSCVRIGQAELSQDPDEPFDSFKARAVIAAKASGSRFIMIYVAERYKQFPFIAITPNTPSLTSESGFGPRADDVRGVREVLDAPAQLDDLSGLLRRENAVRQIGKLALEISIAHWPLEAAYRVFDMFFQNSAVVKLDRHGDFLRFDGGIDFRNNLAAEINDDRIAHRPVAELFLATSAFN